METCRRFICWQIKMSCVSGDSTRCFKINLETDSLKNLAFYSTISLKICVSENWIQVLSSSIIYPILLCISAVSLCARWCLKSKYALIEIFKLTDLEIMFFRNCMLIVVSSWKSTKIYCWSNAVKKNNHTLTDSHANSRANTFMIKF